MSENKQGTANTVDTELAQAVPETFLSPMERWDIVANRLSPLTRSKIVYEAMQATDAVFKSLHEHTGWCGDIDPENFAACWPCVAIVLAQARPPSRGEH